MSEEWQRSKFEQKTSCLWSYFSNTHRSDEEESILYGQLWTRLPASANHISAHSTTVPEETLILKNIFHLNLTSWLKVREGGGAEKPFSLHVVKFRAGTFTKQKENE